jgi:hypothetical protein
MLPAPDVLNELPTLSVVARGDMSTPPLKARLELSQAPPFKLMTPAGFPVGRFMEIAYRVFGKNAVEARDLSRKFVANPAWLLVFPGHDTVREVPVRSGDAVAASGSGGMCFFWHTSDRIFVIGAGKMNEELGVAIANSMADQRR